MNLNHKMGKYRLFKFKNRDLVAQPLFISFSRLSQGSLYLFLMVLVPINVDVYCHSHAFL